jgi:hypothetical protein
MVRFATVAAVLALMAAPLVAQESTEQLRKELESLRKEVDGMKADRVQYESKEVAGAAKVDADSMAPEGDSPIMTALKGTKLSGFVDAGYMFTFNSLHGDPGNNPGATGRAFDNRGHSFYLNAVQLNLERLATKDMIVGYHLELAAGHDVTVYEGSTVGLQEGWVEILAPVGTGLDIKIGKMATLVGYEVVESKDDFNYSRGLLFTNIQPITHTGVRGTYNINDQMSATFGLSNGLNSLAVPATADTFSDPDHGKQFEFNFTMKPNKDVMVAATLLVGNDTTSFGGASGNSGDKYYLFDIVASYTMDKLTLALNLDWASAQLVGNARAPFTGIALYAKYTWTDAMASAVRVEYLSDQNGALFGPQGGGATPVGTDSGSGSRLFGITLTQEMKVAQQLILRVELRSDNSNNHDFVRDGRNALGDTSLGFEAIMPF